MAAQGAVAEDRTPLRRPAKAQAGLNEAGECKKLGVRERVDRRHGVHSDPPADCRRAAVPRQRTAVNNPDRRFGGGRQAPVVDSVRGVAGLASRQSGPLLFGPTCTQS